MCSPVADASPTSRFDGRRRSLAYQLLNESEVSATEGIRSSTEGPLDRLADPRIAFLAERLLP
jgi:hypothetical protein